METSTEDFSLKIACSAARRIGSSPDIERSHQMSFDRQMAQGNFG